MSYNDCILLLRIHLLYPYFDSIGHIIYGLNNGDPVFFFGAPRFRRFHSWDHIRTHPHLGIYLFLAAL